MTEHSTTGRATPDKIMQLITGGWACSILAAGANHGIFTALEKGPASTEELAKATDISVRGAQALLDGLTGLGLLTLAGGRYRNSPEASAFLVKNKPGYLGAMAEVMLAEAGTWQKLPESAKTGRPGATHTTDLEDNPFWHALVPAIASLALPVAKMTGERLGIAEAGRASWLDVGGGSGVWSAVWLGMNPEAAGVQLDWPIVNKIGRDFVAGFGVAGRFKTIDGDFHTADFGTGYDFGIYSNIAHQETPADNLAVFRKFRKAIKPGGTLVVSDFVLGDERTGHPFAMMFSSQMLVVTNGGSAYREADYRKWLNEAGFPTVEFVATPGPSTIVLAK